MVVFLLPLEAMRAAPPGYVHGETRRVLEGNNCGDAEHFVSAELTLDPMGRV